MVKTAAMRVNRETKTSLHLNWSANTLCLDLKHGKSSLSSPGFILHCAYKVTHSGNVEALLITMLGFMNYIYTKCLLNIIFINN